MVRFFSLSPRVTRTCYLSVLALLAAVSIFLGVPELSGLAGTTLPYPHSAPQGWYRGNTHTHTTNSDGDSSPLAVASRYKQLGYNFVVITDHNRLTDVDALNAEVGIPNQFLVMRGVEVTDNWNGKPVHINGLNNISNVLPQHGNSVIDTINNNVAAIRQAGGLAYIAHPNFGFALTPDDFKNETATALFEIYNAHPVVNNAGDETHPSVERLWDDALSNGSMRYGIAADDEHTLSNYSGALPGRAWIMVRASGLTPEAITEAIEQGDFYASTGVTLQDYQVSDTGVRIDVASDANGPTTVYFFGRNGQLLQQSTSNPAFYSFTGDEMYVRAKIVNAVGQAAWTQPVFTAHLRPGNPILNAASLGNEPQSIKTVSPNSIAIAWGLGLAHTTQYGRPDSANAYPTNLGGTSVTVNGRAAELFYVSSSQVNFHVPNETEPGTAEVIIANSDGIRVRGLLTVATAAPGVFTEDGSGRGTALKFEVNRLLPGLFIPHDSVHRFLIFATGLQLTSQVTVLINDQPATIESLRECRHMPGLFQLNLGIPESSIVPGDERLILIADGKTSNPAVLHF